MTSYTAEKIEAFIAENESNTYILASLDILHAFAALLRERESAPVVPLSDIKSLLDDWRAGNDDTPVSDLAELIAQHEVKAEL